jgi:hypothetical protein
MTAGYSTPNAQVAQDLRAAANVLRRDGWTQGGLSLDGRRCVVEALFRATPGVGRALVAADFLRSTVVHKRIARWNDEPGRTADEVFAAIEAAVAAAEQAVAS